MVGKKNIKVDPSSFGGAEPLPLDPEFAHACAQSVRIDAK